MPCSTWSTSVRPGSTIAAHWAPRAAYTAARAARSASKASVPFCHWRHLEEEADRIFGKMRQFEPIPSEVDGAGAAIAEALAELNGLHPFREGNGRTQRAFLRQWMAEAGWHVAWDAISPEENIAACERALISVDHRPLTDLIGPHLGRLGS